MTTFFHPSTVLYLSITLGSGGWCASASSQEAVEKTTSPSANKTIENIIVYGTKRTVAENAQNVSGQVSAFNNEQLAARHVISLEDLSRTTPNVQMEGVGTMLGTANFSFRGQGINSSIPSVDPTVGIFVDGIYIGSTYGVVIDMFDLESIEIYKGPQGVLSGRNTVGGAVHLRSIRPDGTKQIKGDFGIESGLQYKGSFSIQSPIVKDKLSGKVAIQYRQDNGYFENSTQSRDFGKAKALLLRPTLVFTPSGKFEATAIWEHGDISGDGSVAQDSSGDVTPMMPATHHVTASEEPGFTNIEWDQLTLDMNMDTGNGTLTNTFGYRETLVNSLSDLDGVGAKLFNAHFINDYSQVSNELRYNNMLNDNWDFVTGLYYLNSSFSYSEGRDIGAVNVSYGGVTKQDHSTVGIFTNNIINISEVFNLNFGVRYTLEKKSVTINRLTTCSFAFVCNDAPAFSDNKWNNLSPKVGIDYQFNKDAKLYAHVVRGHRAGGYNARSNLVTPQSYDPERVDSLEVGLKSQWLDDRLRINAGTFINKIYDMQRSVRTIVGTEVVQDIFNTATGKIYGLELSSLYLISDMITFNASVGYLKGSYTDVSIDLTGDGLINQADLNLELPRLAELTSNLGLVYDVETSYGRLSTSFDYSYRSDIFLNDANTEIIPSATVIDLGVKFMPHGKNWNISVYAKNLTNSYLTGTVASLGLGSFGSSYLSPMQKGRRFGINFSFTL